jgi:hypothetical protein
MTGNSIIQDTILKILEHSEPLTPYEIKIKTEKEIGRSVFRSSISTSLRALKEKGSIERKLYKGKVSYSVSNQFHKQAI